jgi:hypothetical protein
LINSASKSVSLALYGAIHGAKIAAAMNVTATTSPITANGRRRNRRRSSRRRSACGEARCARPRASTSTMLIGSPRPRGCAD